MYYLNDTPSLNFQLNRLVNIDMGDLDKVRELFFAYFEDFFAGEHPIVEKFEVPYETYTLPLFKMNPEGTSKGDIVVHGGFYAPRASAFDERITRCVSVAQFPALRTNLHDSSFAAGLIWGLLNVILLKLRT